VNVAATVFVDLRTWPTRPVPVHVTVVILILVTVMVLWRQGYSLPEAITWALTGAGITRAASGQAAGPLEVGR
jgi:hypothetical protein